MATTTFQELSRGALGPEREQGASPGLGELQVGALLRMADAAERMAGSHRELAAEADRYRKLYLEQREANATLRRTNATLRMRLHRAESHTRAQEPVTP